MTDFRTFFEQAYPGKDKIYEDIILPIFKNATDLRKTTPIALAESDKKNVLQASIITQVALCRILFRRFARNSFFPIRG